jgi:hypothetical protein
LTPWVKSSPQMWVIFKNCLKKKITPNGRKLAQSGHPDC